MSGIVENDFTERYESFTDKLLILWTDNMGGLKKVVEDDLEPPTQQELISMYCRVISEEQAEEVENDLLLMDDDLLKKGRKDKSGNKILDLVASLTSAEIDITNFLDMELEMVFQVLEIVGEKKKKAAEKAKRQRRKS